jgi:hypothetical protein
VTRPVALSLWLPFLSFPPSISFPLTFLALFFPGQRLSRRVVTGRVDIRSICSSGSPRDFCSLSLFLYLSFLFHLCSYSLLLKLCRFLFLFSLSLFRLICYVDRTILRRHCLSPRLQWYQLLVAPLLNIPLTLS